MQKKRSLKVVDVQEQEAQEPYRATSLLEPGFKWTRGSDVQKTWRRYGWVPPSETKFKDVYVTFA